MRYTFLGYEFTMVQRGDDRFEFVPAEGTPPEVVAALQYSLDDIMRSMLDSLGKDTPFPRLGDFGLTAGGDAMTAGKTGRTADQWTKAAELQLTTLLKRLESGQLHPNDEERGQVLRELEHIEQQVVTLRLALEAHRGS